MARLLLPLTILALCLPLLAIKCYDSSQGYIDCNGGKYCVTQTVVNTNKVNKFCGNKIFGNQGVHICQKDGENDYADTRNWCCTGDYCNSSKSVGSILTFVVSCLALFANKI